MAKIKAVGTTWHVMHQTDLINALKDDVDFYLMDNAWRSWRSEKFTGARAIPENVNFVYGYEPGKYDFALLHIDQQCLNPVTGKSRVFREFNECIQDVPKVVINHGSPVFPEHFKQEQMNDQDAIDACREEMKKWVGNNPMVVNSYTNAEDQRRGWGWGTPIWHGMDSEVWQPGIKEINVITALSPGGLDDYYNRSCMNDVMEILLKETGYALQWARVTQYASTGDSPAKYKNFLATGLIYVDTSIETPMNRARTEAMLSGCCVVQVEGGHDLDKFAVDGENMVLVPNNPQSIVKKIAELLANPAEAKRIGENGRKTAMEKFNPARYRNDWLNFLQKNVLQ